MRAVEANMNVLKSVVKYAKWLLILDIAVGVIAGVVMGLTMTGCGDTGSMLRCTDGGCVEDDAGSDAGGFTPYIEDGVVYLAEDIYYEAYTDEGLPENHNYARRTYYTSYCGDIELGKSMSVFYTLKNLSATELQVVLHHYYNSNTYDDPAPETVVLVLDPDSVTVNKATYRAQEQYITTDLRVDGGGLYTQFTGIWDGTFVDLSVTVWYNHPDYPVSFDGVWTMDPAHYAAENEGNPPGCAVVNKDFRLEP